MPRKTSLRAAVDTLRAIGFNEAAARCRGKPVAVSPDGVRIAPLQ